MSPKGLVITITYKTRVALQVLVRNSREPLQDSGWTAEHDTAFLGIFLTKSGSTSVFVLLRPTFFSVKVSKGNFERRFEAKTLVLFDRGPTARERRMRLEGLPEQAPPTANVLPFDGAKPVSPAFQLAILVEQIQRATFEARKLLLGRSLLDLTTILEPDSWSAAQCMDHLAQTTNAFVPAISKAILAAPKLATNRPLRTGTIALLLIGHLEPPYRLRYKVLSQFVPQEKDFDAAWAAFEESQSRLSESICSAAGLAIDRVRVQSPVHAPVTYNVYGAFRILAAHQRRHLWQVQQILGKLDERRAQQPAV